MTHLLQVRSSSSTCSFLRDHLISTCTVVVVVVVSTNAEYVLACTSVDPDHLASPDAS